ncbi:MULTISPECIES: hypothetical protein [Bradyrhizobium]|uniref:hypothetical protein n=1 Tax=Bradyrhizobium TaxID=374 RepID=UPI0004B7A5CB|nr:MULTISPECIES: hypothetical protein [Bradyrhizobium]MCA1375672.1 hypothetical protein [Bradyrhizobium sp. IC4060]MCA1485815.1 hypothetical protein [Bradyrhizobium sp. IC4061]
MESGAGPSSKPELTIVERYKRAARENMDGPELLKLLKEVEDEMKRRGLWDH